MKQVLASAAKLDPSLGDVSITGPLCVWIWDTIKMDQNLEAFCSGGVSFIQKELSSKFYP